MPTQEPGWFDVGKGRLRYWDGESWTDQYKGIDVAPKASYARPIASRSSRRATKAPVAKTVPSTKLVAAGGVATMIIVSALGGFLTSLRSMPTTVSWVPAVSVVAPGGDLAVSGQVTPAGSGRRVLLESAPGAQGPWRRMPQATITDDLGRFAITLKPQLTGSVAIRVVVDPAGRYRQGSGESKPFRFLAASSVNLKGGGAVPARSPVNLTAAVHPPIAGRTVMIEQSRDKVSWVPVGRSTLTDASGTVAVTVPGPATGSSYYRASVAEDEKFIEGVSPVVEATVEDVKAAAATYLGIVNKFNVALDVYFTAAGRTKAGPGVIGNLRKAAGPLSAAHSSEAAALRAYRAWPQPARSLISQLIAQDVIQADLWHRLSVVADLDSWDNLQPQAQSASAESGRLSTLIRQTLGLPKVPTG